MFYQILQLRDYALNEDFFDQAQSSSLYSNIITTLKQKTRKQEVGHYHYHLYDGLNPKMQKVCNSSVKI